MDHNIGRSQHRPPGLRRASQDTSIDNQVNRPRSGSDELGRLAFVRAGSPARLHAGPRKLRANSAGRSIAGRVSQETRAGLPAPIDTRSTQLQKLYEGQANKWSTLYNTNGKFGKRIDKYHTARQEFIALREAGQLSAADIEQCSIALGTRLAIAFGLLDKESGQWAPDTQQRIDAGGSRYAESSIWANDQQQLPSILRSAAVLTRTLGGVALGGGAAIPYISGGVGVLYVLGQVRSLGRIPFLQAPMQSRDVALRLHMGPLYQPNITASDLINEDESKGTLRGVAFLESRIGELEAIRNGDLQDLDLAGEKATAEVNALGARIRTARAENATATTLKPLEQKLSEAKGTLAMYWDIRGPIKPPAKRKGKGKGKGKAKAKGKAATAETPQLPGAWVPVDTSPQSKQQVHSRLDGAIVRAKNALSIEKLFAQMGHQVNQGSSRLIRSTLNAAAGAFSMLSALSGYTGALGPWNIAALQGLSLGMQVLQVTLYKLIHGGKAAKDYEGLLATQFQALAVTGRGNLASKNGALDPQRLDAMMVNALDRRILHFKSVLEYDRSVYLVAMASLIADSTGDWPEGSSLPASLAHLARLEPKKLGTYVLGKLHLLRTNDANDVVLEMDEHDHSPGAKMEKILALHGENEANIRRLTSSDGGLDLVGLLSESSTLPLQSRDMLFHALMHARCELGDGADDLTDTQKRGFAAHDHQLAVLKGKTESRGDVTSSHQAAQKFGHVLAFGVAGSGGPLVTKLAGEIARGAMYFYDAKGLKDAIALVSLGTNTVGLFGSVIGMYLGYAYHNNIGLKERIRQNDKAVGPAVPNAPVGRWWSPSPKKVEHFRTLAGKQIPAACLVPPPSYESTVRLIKDIAKQMTALEPKHFRSNVDISAAALEISSIEEADQVIAKAQQKLEAVRRVQDYTAQWPPPQSPDTLRAQETLDMIQRVMKGDRRARADSKKLTVGHLTECVEFINRVLAGKDSNPFLTDEEEQSLIDTGNFIASHFRKPAPESDEYSQLSESHGDDSDPDGA